MECINLVREELGIKGENNLWKTELEKTNEILKSKFKTI